MLFLDPDYVLSDFQKRIFCGKKSLSESLNAGSTYSGETILVLVYCIPAIHIFLL